MRVMRRKSPFARLRSAAVAIAAATVCVAPAAAQEFFRGKTVNIYIGFGAGGSYDFYGHLMARHLGKHLPGNPVVVANSMPGAGSLRAANFLFTVAPKDGTALGIVTQTLPLEEVLGNPGAKYRSAEFNWIGRVTNVADIVMTWHTSKTRNIDDLRRIETPIATTGPGSPTDGFPRLLNALAGTKFKLVSGYQGSTAGMLAMERGETDASSTSWGTLTSRRSDWLRDKRVNLLLFYMGERFPEAPDVPAAGEMGLTEEGRQILKLYASGADIGRSFIAPPGVAAERVAELRRAFDLAVADPALREEIRKANADLEPLSGAAMQKMVEDILKSPPALVERMKNIIAGR
jgi:tripartite-type tricarboxylate transporter receptor subunit TctC